MEESTLFSFCDIWMLYLLCKWYLLVYVMHFCNFASISKESPAFDFIESVMILNYFVIVEFQSISIAALEGQQKIFF